MRWTPVAWFVALIGSSLTGAARGEDIVDVLRRSQQLRLERLQPADDAGRVAVVQRSFEDVHAAMGGNTPVALQVIAGELLAETLHGHIVVANASLADLPEGARLFILAHELGHVHAGHWQQMGRVFQRWVPGEVTPGTTQPVAALLGRDASALAHRQEFEADAFALQVLRAMGRPPQDALLAFVHLGLPRDTATHPAAHRRAAVLSAEAQRVRLENSGHDAE